MLRGIALSGLLLAACDQDNSHRSAPPPAPAPGLIAPETARLRRFSAHESCFDCEGEPPALLAIGQDALLLDGFRLEDEPELRRVLRGKWELSRRLGAPPGSVYVRLLEPRPSLVRLRDILAAVRREGFDDITLQEE